MGRKTRSRTEAKHRLETEQKQNKILRLEQEKDDFRGQIVKMKEEHPLELKKKQDRILRLTRESDDYMSQMISMGLEHRHKIGRKQCRIQDLEDENDGYIKEKTKEIEDLRAQLTTEQSQILVLKRAMLASIGEKTSRIEVLQTELQKACSSQEKQKIVVKELCEIIVRKEESVKKVETKIAVFERERQFQLGRFNRSSLFEEFSKHARSVLDGRSFSGDIKGQPVNVCICVLSATKEVLLVVQRCKDDAYMGWQSRTEEYTLFQRDWRYWIRLEGGMQGEQVYISMDLEDKLRAWFPSSLSSWVLSIEEMKRLADTSIAQ